MKIGWQDPTDSIWTKSTSKLQIHGSKSNQVGGPQVRDLMRRAVDMVPTKAYDMASR